MATTLPVLSADEFVAHIFAQSGVLPTPVAQSYGTELNRYLHVGIDHVDSPDTHKIALLPALVELDECAREIFGGPILTNAGYRSVHHENSLRTRGYKTAGFVSPHSLGCALDKQVPARKSLSPAENLRLQQAYIAAAEKLKLPRPRLGHRAYGESFTHVDLVFLLFQPYTLLPHPSTWHDLPPRVGASLLAWRPGMEW